MAKRRTRTRKHTKDNNIDVAVLIIISILLAVLIFTKSGYIGEQLSPMLGGLVGVIKYIIPLGTFALAIGIATQKKDYAKGKIMQYTVFLLCICVILCIFEISKDNLSTKGEFWSIVKNAYTLGESNQGGGAIGAMVAIPLINLIGMIGTIILNAVLAIVLLMFMLGFKPAEMIQNLVEEIKERREEYEEDEEEEEIDEEKPRKMKEKKTKKEKLRKQDVIPEEQLKIPDEQQITINLPDEKENKKAKKSIKNILKKPEEEIKPEKVNPNNIEANLFKQEVEQKEEKTKQVLTLEHTLTSENENYEFPPIELLEQGETQILKGGKKVVTDTATKLQKTLYSFGVSAKVEKVSVGPSITRYELKPAEGVRVSKIAKLSDDIALNLAAESIRIEAPIPGKQAVGIEIPNKEKQVVPLRDIIDSDKFKNSKSKVSMALGKDVAGEEVIADIAKMPHVLIAGSTGSGKSVCINTLITSIIYKAKPSEVKLLLVDPKVVELSVYNGIPHLLIPVVTDPKKAAGALAWAVQEMVNRYSLFAAKGVRDIKGYNEELEKEEGGEKLPQIVIIIDELADLMMVAPGDVEDAICRLAQMARAAGMHLVIATQRPSVDVITGIIKANIPSRIAFAVSSGVDSRTILDMTGAEKLLGKGDMLFSPVGVSKPMRIQGAYISDKEVEKIVDFLKSNGETTYSEDILEKIENNATPDKEIKDEDDDTDQFLMDAIETVIETGQASTSFIQRRFKVGYARAGRIMDQMEARGIISGYEGSKPRQVLMTKERWQELKTATPPEEN